MDYEQSTAVPMLTDTDNLPDGKVIHIVGPIMPNQFMAEHEEKLAACCQNTLDMRLENRLKSVAFCCISTGAFHFPNKTAARIAVERVIFNVFRAVDKEYDE